MVSGTSANVLSRSLSLNIVFQSKDLTSKRRLQRVSAALGEGAHKSTVERGWLRRTARTASTMVAVLPVPKLPQMIVGTRRMIVAMLDTAAFEKGQEAMSVLFFQTVYREPAHSLLLVQSLVDPIRLFKHEFEARWPGDDVALDGEQPGSGDRFRPRRLEVLLHKRHRSVHDDGRA